MTEEKQIDCPNAKTLMTPCYRRDGDVAIVHNIRGYQICVGCERSIERMREEAGKTL